MAEPAVELSVRRCFLLGGCTNYCHWLLDYLPRLQFYRADCGPLLINGPVQSFQAQALTHFGIKMSDVMPLEYPRAYRVNKLFYPRTASTVSTIDWLRDKFNGLRVPGRAQRKLFISRAGSLQTYARKTISTSGSCPLLRKRPPHFRLLRAARTRRRI
jgi:capsular polysaccharide biosynthesis protein